MPAELPPQLAAPDPALETAAEPEGQGATLSARQIATEKRSVEMFPGVLFSILQVRVRGFGTQS